MAYDPTIFNVDPYYDDYNDDKKFLRVLYKPGYAVQARELTQSQTIAQNQIKRFGDHIFKDGSIVKESQVFVNDIKFVRIDGLAGYAGVSVGDFEGLTATVAGKNTIRVLKTLSGLTGSDKDTKSLLFFSDYLYGATGFSAGDTITSNYNGTTISATVSGDTSSYNDYSGAPNTLPIFGDAKLVGIDSGVRYIKGYFVNHDQQKIVAYNITGSSTANSYRRFNNLESSVGFDVTNTIVSAVDDSTLNDPAFGSYNYAAPGADRYRLDLTLAQSPLSTTADYQLLTIKDDNVLIKSNYPEYNVLADTLARRTYDESGNYTLDDFPISVQDITGDENESKLAIKIGKGKAYVFGYEFTNTGTVSLTADKARTTRRVNTEQEIPFVIGNTVASTINTGLTSNIFHLIDWNSAPLYYLSSGSSGAFSKVGTARVGKFDAVENSSRIHVYDVKLDSGFTAGSAQRLFLPGYTGTNQHIFTFSGSGLNMSQASFSSLLFPLSNDITSYAVRQIHTHQFNIQRSIVRNLSTSTPTTINITDFDSDTEFATGTWMRFNSSNDVKAFSMTGAQLSTFVNNFVNKSFDLTAGAGGTAVIFVNIETKQIATDQPFYRAKTSVTESSTVSMVGNSYEKFAYINGKVDVYGIVSITGNTGGSSFSMTDWFDLDTGQRDSIYDWSRIVLKKQYYSAGVTGVSCTYKRYSHENSCAPYLLDSYGNPATMISGTAAAYKQIPVYVQETQRGNVVSLGGCLDARPDRITPSSFGITSNPQDYGATGGSHLIGSSFNIDWTYYQPRTDKVVLTRNKNFKIITGITGNDQAPEPQDDAEAMTLGSVTYFPFTKVASDTSQRIVKNRRYTMRDIGNLDKRIDRVEYYTTLSLAEKDAKSLEIKDENGLNKFKNGIFVDSFSSQVNADYSNTNHICSVDPVRLEARPTFATKYCRFSLTGSVPAGLTFNQNGLMMCNYTTEIFVQQLLASKAVNVNPFDVFNFNGRLTMVPQSDDWIDVQRNPDVIVNVAGENSGLADGQQYNLGTVWNNWEDTWLGTPTSISEWKNIEKTPEHSVINPASGNKEQRFTDVQYATQRVGQSRTGIRTYLTPETTTRNLGTRVVNTSVIPYMRAVDINIKADGMRPNVQVYPFFDGQNVSQYVSVGGVVGGAITTDINGRVGYDAGITFSVPSGVFRTGERLLRLIDQASDVVADSTTTAEDVFRAQGILKTEEATIISTRNLVLRREIVNSDRVIDRNIIFATRVRYHDPVAQTFLIDPSPYPAGIYIKKVDLYFKKKSTNLPITLQIRPTSNGYPSSFSIIPFSEVVKLPSEVNISDDSSEVTTFEFSEPVYLQPGEYAMTLLSNSNEYEVFISEVTQEDLITGRIIAAQPYAGSFFKSQNASTWTAEQLLDLKFRIHKCVFSSGGTVNFEFTETDFDTGYGVNGLSNGANLFRLNTTYIQPPSTSLSTTVDFEGDGVGAIKINPNENLSLATRKNIRDAATDTITTAVTFATDNSDVTPSLDMQRISGLYVQNIIRSFNDYAQQEEYEKLPSVAGITVGDASLMRYITRQVSLQDGFESNNVDVYFAARLPAGSEIGVYLKSQSPTDNTRFNDLPYEKLVIHPSYASSYGATSQYLSLGEDDYVDLRFTRGTTATTRTSGITGETLMRKWQVKVVMYGDVTNSIVPAVKEFKAIAT